MKTAIGGLLIASLFFLGPRARAVDYVSLVSGSITDGAGDAGRGAAWGVLVCQRDNFRPIAWFGAVKSAGEKSKYLYMVVFKTPKDYDRGGFDFSGSAEASFSHGSGAIETTFGGKRFEMSYDLILDAASHELTKGILRINDEELKLDEARVYIADITGEAAKYIPVQIDLPGAPDVSDADAMKWGGQVAKTIAELKEKPETAMLLHD